MQLSSFPFEKLPFLPLVTDVTFLDIDPRKLWRIRAFSIVPFSFPLQLLSLPLNWDLWVSEEFYMKFILTPQNIVLI